MYCLEEFRELLPGTAIVQVNRTHTLRRGSVRGLHFQRAPYADGKFVTCLRGVIFDVAVDLRQGSATFLQWHAVQLEGNGTTTFYIPPGFAHGLQTLTEDCEVLYLHTAIHMPDAEGGLHPQDPRVRVAWPEEVTELSVRDRSQPFLSEDFCGLTS